MDHPNDKTNWVTANVAVATGAVDILPCNVINASKIKINSPAYKFPNNRNDKEIAREINVTDSSTKLKGMASTWSKGFKVNSLVNPFTPLTLILLNRIMP